MGNIINMRADNFLVGFQDFIQHLKYVLEDKWVKIIEYKGKKINLLHFYC